jgi:molybdenum cofactor cytidylyltransferase
MHRAFRIQPKEIVAFVGAGGKTTAMFRLADELAAAGRRVVTTTTTRLFAAQTALAPHRIIYQDEPVEQFTARLTGQLARQPHILVHGPLDAETDKVVGLSPHIVDAIATLPQSDAVLVEADGARMRSFKAPADHEPVIPTRTTLLVPVVGIDALGSPLADQTVHRAERVAQLADVTLGAEVTPEIVATVLTHPQGGLKGLPQAGRVTPLVNKVENEKDLATAQHLADRLLANQRIDAVVVGAMRTEDPVIEVRDRVAAVVLAAGASQRFGTPKQLLPWQGKTLLGHTVEQVLASRANPVIVVLGHQADACHTALGDRPVTVVINSEWEQGQSTSVRAGLAALPANVGAAIFPLADQPGITPPIIDALIERHQTTLAPVVWPEYEGKRGNPVLFDRDTFPQLMSLSGDTGGRPVLHQYTDRAERVPILNPDILFDIDTPKDFQEARERLT